MLTTDDLEAWRESRVTRRLLGNLRRMAEVRRRLILERFWAVGEVPPEEVAQVKEALALLDDLETTTVAEIEESEASLDEYERNSAG